MRAQRDMILQAREAQARRLNLDAKEHSQHRSRMRRLIDDAPETYDLSGPDEE